MVVSSLGSAILSAYVLKYMNDLYQADAFRIGFFFLFFFTLHREFW